MKLTGGPSEGTLSEKFELISVYTWFTEFFHFYIWKQQINEHFSMYLLGNPIHVCLNPQNKAHFPQMIDLRGHMLRFTLKIKD